MTGLVSRLDDRFNGAVFDDPAADARLAVAAVADDPQARLRLLEQMYATRIVNGRRHLPYRRAAVAFMGWQINRGLLNPMDHPAPGSPWWRELNSALLFETYEARRVALGRAVATTPGAEAVAEFIHQPSARRWYRAHNMTIVNAYLAHEELAWAEGRIERFFINLALIRVLYAHALVAAPRMALGWLAPLAPPLGDPRLGMTAIFLSLSRVLPHRYPLGDDIETAAGLEGSFGHLLDVGVIQPRVKDLYAWSAEELNTPGLLALLEGDTPVYAWDSADSAVWHPAPSRTARAARRVLAR